MCTVASFKNPHQVIGLIDHKARKWGPFLLLALAVAYYSAYFNCGLNLGGEGGTNAVIAMRLMEGQRPIADTFLGYNVLWFWPIAWLFEVSGPDYLAMRFYFFGICTLTSLLAWATVWRVTRSGLLALATGVLLILIPGMLFRNYMGLMPVGNQLAFVSAFILPVSSSKKRIFLIAVSGAVLGLTYLIRIEVGLLMSVIWVGLLVVHTLQPNVRWRASFRESLLGGLLGIAAFVGVHAPFAAHAHLKGYAGVFYEQYAAFIGLFHWEMQKEIKAMSLDNSGSPVTGLEVSGTLPVMPEVADGRRTRPAIKAIFSEKKSRDRYFAAAIYLPAFLAFLMVIGGTLAVFAGWFRKNGGPWQDGWTVLVMVGCALTLFPQYFSFRPDTPHLSEFMIPFIPALAVASALAFRRAPRGPWWVVALASTFLVMSAIQIWIHIGHAWPKESAGTIAAKKHGPAVFTALNGVSVKLKSANAEALSKMQDVIVKNSSTADWVVCYPYSPTINFMTDRRSYLWDLYTDNTMAGQEFDSYHIGLLKLKEPAVVVIDHRAINSSEESRFPNWAPNLYAYLKENFQLAGEFLGNEVFVRKPQQSH